MLWDIAPYANKVWSLLRDGVEAATKFIRASHTIRHLLVKLSHFALMNKIEFGNSFTFKIKNDNSLVTGHGKWYS